MIVRSLTGFIDPGWHPPPWVCRDLVGFDDGGAAKFDRHRSLGSGTLGDLLLGTDLVAGAVAQRSPSNTIPAISRQ